MEKSINNILVSIIIPVYNTGEYLVECLDSIRNQTYSNLEIICIDDGSTDNSKKILEQYSKKDKRIKVFYKQHQGVSSARNFAIEQAKGDYITFIDSDDMLSKKSIETSIKLTNKKNADIIINNLNLRLNIYKKEIKDFSYLMTVQLFVAKTLLNKYSKIRYNPLLIQAEDAIFTHKLLALASCIYKNVDSTYFYRTHKEQNSKKNINSSQKMLENIKLQLKELQLFYDEYNLWQTHKYHCANYLLEVIFTTYITVNWTKQQQKELFNLIHSFIKQHDLIIDFSYHNNRTKLYKLFVNSQNYKSFEIYRIVTFISLKIVNLYKNLKNNSLRKII